MNLRLFSNADLLKIQGFHISPDSSIEDLLIIKSNRGLNVAIDFSNEEAWGGHNRLKDQVKNYPIRIFILNSIFANINRGEWGEDVYDRIVKRASIIYDEAERHIIAASTGDKDVNIPVVELLNGISFSKEGIKNSFNLSIIERAISNNVRDSENFIIRTQDFEFEENEYSIELLSNFNENKSKARCCLLLTDAPLKQTEIQQALSNSLVNFKDDRANYEFIALMNPYHDVNEGYENQKLINRLKDNLEKIFKEIY